MTEQLIEEYIAQMKKDQAELPDRIFEAEMTSAQKRKENRHKSEPQCLACLDDKTVSCRECGNIVYPYPITANCVMML